MLAPSVVSAEAIQSKICSPFTGPTITAPADNTTTGSTSIHIAGTGEPGMTVSIIRNSSGAGVATAASDGSFVVDIPLDVGDNFVTAREMNDCSTVKESQNIVVHRSSTYTSGSTTNTSPAATSGNSATPSSVTGSSSALKQPAVSDLNIAAPPLASTENQSTNLLTPTQLKAQEEIITQPKANQTVSSDRLWVTGKAAAFSTVDIYINLTIVARVIASEEGIYGVLVGIQQGGNTIQVQATNVEGVVTTRTISIKLDKNTKSGAATANSSPTQILTIVVITAISTGGAILISTLLWHTHTLRARMRKFTHV